MSHRMQWHDCYDTHDVTHAEMRKFSQVRKTTFANLLQTFATFYCTCVDSLKRTVPEVQTVNTASWKLIYCGQEMKKSAAIDLKHILHHSLLSLGHLCIELLIGHQGFSVARRRTTLWDKQRRIIQHIRSLVALTYAIDYEYDEKDNDENYQQTADDRRCDKHTISSSVSWYFLFPETV